MTLRSHLIALVLAVLLPMVAFAALVMLVLGSQQRAAAERGGIETARALVNAVDESLRGTVTSLQLLATSRALAADDLRAFHAEARRALASQSDWMDILLLAPDGQQLVHTSAPPGQPLPRVAEPASLYAAVTARQPVVGNASRGRLGPQVAVPVRVPIMRDDRVVYVLTAAVKPESLLSVLTRQRLAPGWVAAAFDRVNTIAARTRKMEEFTGNKLSPEFLALLDRGAAEGWAVTHTLEGERVYTAYARSAQTGWGVGVGIPAELVDAPLQRSLLAIGAGGLAFALLALAVALIMGRRITAPMLALSSAARAFGERGVLPRDGAAALQEVEDIRHAFVEAAALVQRRAAEAEAAARAKDEFLAVLSHELRTPLNAVYGWARMLQTGQVTGEHAARALDVIVRQSNAQVQLIDDLLDVSRVITGKMRLDVRAVDLGLVIEHALDAVGPAADAKAIRIHRVLDPRAGPVTGDPDRLQQVVFNVLSNAVKFTPRGGRVQVSLQRVESHVEIAVSDTGRGIAADVLPHVFERFRQADSSSTREHAGLGLGLALVKHLVELHGGSVSAQSAGEGRGATFVIALPLALAEQPEGRAPRAHPTAPVGGVAVAGARLDGLRVLVVDDDREALDLAATILTGAGAQVRVSASSKEGLAALLAWRPDVLVSDIEMPGEDGYSLIRTVRALGPSEGGRTPAVALTAYGRTQDRVASLTAGYSMHVPKPVDPGELLAIIASVAGRGSQLS
jgi:signal transduction histidine kinase/ActR/RegA family two-component response regulator